MPLSEEGLRHIEAQIEAANTESDWFQLGHEHIEELVAALHERDARITELVHRNSVLQSENDGFKARMFKGRGK